jgi:hypothetical protein
MITMPLLNRGNSGVIDEVNKGSASIALGVQCSENKDSRKSALSSI